MKSEKICLFYVSKAHLLVIMNEYLKDKEDYELITFLQREINDETSEINTYEVADIEGLIDFSITKKPEDKKIEDEQSKIILIEGDEKYREKVNTYIQQEIKKLNINNLKIINMYSFEENKLKMSQIFKKNEKILYTIGEENIEQ